MPKDVIHECKDSKAECAYLLEKVLKRVQSGEVDGVAIITLGTNGENARGFASIPVGREPNAIEALMRLMIRLDGEPEEDERV